MVEGRPLREDVDRFRQLLDQENITDLWHFTPLSHVPCILAHGAIFSIEELARRGLNVPPRSSRDDDIRKGVGNVVKTSTMPYWKMLTLEMGRGVPHVFFRLSTEPVLWEDTSFGDRNVWENPWTRDRSYDFARDRIFVRRNFVGSSPPEIYIETELPLAGLVRSIYPYLLDEREVLERCLCRLGIVPPVKPVTAGPRARPFPDRCHDEYVANRNAHFQRLQGYFETVTLESLHRGVEIEP